MSIWSSVRFMTQGSSLLPELLRSYPSSFSITSSYRTRQSLVGASFAPAAYMNCLLISVHRDLQELSKNMYPPVGPVCPLDWYCYRSYRTNLTKSTTFLIPLQIALL
jgi:hypothetical protein